MEGTSTDPRLIVPALGRLYGALEAFAYPLLRFCYGALFIPHGWSKIMAGGVAKYDATGALVGGTAAGMASMNFPMPEVLAW